jgi:hypothetical protein
LKVGGLRLLVSNRPIAGGRHQLGTPQDTNGRNFVPKPDLTRYYKSTRNCLWNGTTVCQGRCWPLSHHSVHRGVAFGSDCG